MDIQSDYNDKRQAPENSMSVNLNSPKKQDASF